MQTNEFIPAQELCTQLRLEIAFISSLQQHGLLEVTIIEEETYIHISQLPELERIVRLHEELEINLEGIEAINHLLKHIKVLQEEIERLKSRLRLYENLD